jgi:hypothetical protein
LRILRTSWGSVERDSQITFSATLGATNASGTNNATLTRVFAPRRLPIITSPASASGTTGNAFSYQIGATNSPTSYSATSFAAPLTVSATGLISGTPAAAGISTVTLAATNAGGNRQRHFDACLRCGSGGQREPCAECFDLQIASLYAGQCTATALSSSGK